MAGRVGGVEDPETLPEERFWGATFENIIPIFLEFGVFERFAEQGGMAFCLIGYAGMYLGDWEGSRYSL